MSIDKVYQHPASPAECYVSKTGYTSTEKDKPINRKMRNDNPKSSEKYNQTKKK